MDSSPGTPDPKTETSAGRLQPGQWSKILRSAAAVGLGTLLSRIAGLIRDQVTAFYFGASPAADAFFVAFRLPNLLRRLLAEGALTPAFVPVFTERLTQEGHGPAAALFRSTLTLLGLILTGVTLLGLWLAPELILILAPGFQADPEQFQLTVRLARIVFPYILFISLTALAMGVLNSLGRFSIPAVGPVLLNISMILGAVILSPRLEEPIAGLAAGALLGGILQLAIQLPFLKKAGPYLGLSFSFKDPAIKKTLKLMAPAALGVAAYQISIFVNTQLASLLPDGSVSWLYYADRLVQFPLGVFTLALSTAVLPALARVRAEGRMEAFEEVYLSSLGLQFFITLPAMAGLMVMAEPLVGLLFERGQFTAQSTQATAQALWAYVLGLPCLSGTSLSARAFFSLSDTKTPARVAAVSLVLGLILAAVLMKPLQHSGLALASSLASLINFLWLNHILGRRQNYNFAPVFREILLYTLWAVLMGAFLWPLYHHPQLAGLSRPAKVAAGLILGPAFYFGLAWFFKCRHLAPLKKIIRRLRGRKEA
ncbi:MAG: murein biosynthesis integral membrane protein MurJ [Deltaproteobacteria bacterium]|jgi:putative peptidoglycan lipid II flippase|nr:murein biosynthesis integral membrane protein MurJ [Deltaproteobacteria bacterium]